MEHPLIRKRLEQQNGVVAVWQLLADGVSIEAIRHAARGWREMHDGVYLSGHAWPTDHQRLMAAALTAPHTSIDRWSAAWYYGLRDRDDGPVTIVRPGSGGLRRIPSRFDPATHTSERPEGDVPATGGVSPVDPGECGPTATRERRPEGSPKHALMLRRSRSLPREDLAVNHEIPMLSASRVVLDLLPLLRKEERRARLVRDALRLEVASPADLHAICERHAGRRGVGQLRGYLDQYARLPATRAKSDAELLAADILEQAGFPRPRLNVLVVGKEGDLVWVAQRHIVELDSNGFHPFPELDELKQRIWEQAGFTVGRTATDDVYSAPHRLLEAARPVLDR